MGSLPRRRAKVLYERHVARTPAVLSTVRHELADRLAAEGVAPATINDTLLVLSELGTNAMHAISYDDEVALKVALEPTGDIDVEVADPGQGFRLSEGLRLADPDDEHGRGLAIVCLLADETTVRRHRRHTVVHALIRARRSA